MSNKEDKCPVIAEFPPCNCDESLNTAFQFSSVTFYENGSVGDNMGNYWGEWTVISNTQIKVSRNHNEIVMSFNLETGEVHKKMQYVDSLILENPIQERILIVPKEMIIELKEPLFDMNPLDNWSMNVSRPFILTPYSSKIDTERKQDLLNDE